MTIAFSVRDVHKVYDNGVVGNDGVSLEVRVGEVVGLLGPNGAGKTTLVRQMTALLRPTAGTILLFGGDVASASPQQVAARVSYLPQGVFALGELAVAEAVTWTATLRGARPPDAARSAGDLLARLGLESVARRQLRRLSGGQRRLVHIAATLAGPSEVLLLDEPTTDVDPLMRKTIWRLAAERAAAGAAVLLVTHDVGEAEHALDRVAIMHAGRVVAEGTPAALKARLAHSTRVEVVVAADGPTDPAAVARHLGPHASVDGRRVTVWVPADDAVRTLEKALAEFGLDALEDVRLVTPSLEDVYLDAADVTA